MLTVGLDVHERTTSICILDGRGNVVKEQAVKGHPRRTLDTLRTLREPFKVCFEASTNYGWMADELRRMTDQIYVAHPGRLRLIFKSRRKNDRLDARRLAKLLYLDEVPVVHVPSPERRAWRGLIEHRQRCVKERTRTKNAMRALLRTHGIESPKGLWSKKGLAWLAQLELRETVALRRDQFLDDLCYQNKKLKRTERELEVIANRHPAIALLQTIPGVGIRTAETFVAYVDDPHRFRSRSIGAYIGLVPKQDASAGVNRLGRITREGPATLRKMLAEATWQAIRRSRSIRMRYEQIVHGRQDRRKKALVATSHHLARVMLAMLKTGEVWTERAALASAA